MKVIYCYDYWNILRKHFFVEQKYQKKKLELGESLSRKKPNHHNNKRLTQREKKRTKDLICLPMNNRKFENLSIFSYSKHGTDKFSNCACFWDLKPWPHLFRWDNTKGGRITPQRLLKNYCLFSWVFVSLITPLIKLWRFCIEMINPGRESEPVEVIASNYMFFYFDFFCVLLECFSPFSTIFLWEMGQKPLRKIRLLVFLELYNQPDNSIFF